MTSTTFFFVFIPLLTFILLAVNLIFAPHNSYQEKNSTFECGFHSFLGQNRTQFSISFFIFALLFLLFDLEILLVYPYVISAYYNTIYGLVIMLIFFLVLTLGFTFELGKNALKIDSRQMYSVATKKLETNSLISSLFLFNSSKTSSYNIQLARLLENISIPKIPHFAFIYHMQNITFNNLCNSIFNSFKFRCVIAVISCLLLLSPYITQEILDITIGLLLMVFYTYILHTKSKTNIRLWCFNTVILILNLLFLMSFWYIIYILISYLITGYANTELITPILLILSSPASDCLSDCWLPMNP